jgi:cell division inhibitor SulA
MPAPTPVRAIDRLRKAANLEPVKKQVELSDGSVFEMWVAPLTMAERERAQKQAKSDDANAFALQLLGLSLQEVRTTMTAEELLGWSAYFQILNEEQQKEIEKAKRRR